ncbi:A disintegrin and metalloproteinase with thrombospondin motifs 9-like, partial [Argonauta hians]
SGHCSTTAGSVALCFWKTGSFIFNGKNYYIQDLKQGSRNHSDLSTPFAHIIFKDKTNWKSKHSYCETHGAHSNFPARNVSVPLHHTAHYNSKASNHSYHSRHKRSDSLERYIELMVVADQEMERYHGADLEHYVFTLLALVTNIYKHPSIKNYLNLVVVKFLVLKGNEENLQVTSNAVKTLQQFCRWQYKMNTDEDGPDHHDAAILLTRMNMCRSENNCETLGLAELGTMCDMKRNCALIQDNGFGSAYTVAHELGHLFNLPHDDSDKCKQITAVSGHSGHGTYHIMSPTLDYDPSGWLWSDCSAILITKFIDLDYAECLLNKPFTKKYHRLRSREKYLPPGLKYDVDTQCRLAFGRNSYSCPTRASFACSRLWCIGDTEETCHSENFPWADGTPCGAAKWCHNGVCVVKRHFEKVDGNWGKWSEYDACTFPCGGGIRKSSRDCNNPVPKHGGAYCIGKRVKYKSCNTKKCPEDTVDFRAAQCSEFNGKIPLMGLPSNVKWLPKYSGIHLKNTCKLYCRTSNANDYYLLKDQVTDGTKCSEDTFDVCVNGKCQRAGCDYQLGSTMKRDRCGVCGGDNSSCRTETGTLTYTKYGYNKVVDIPAGASSIHVSQHGYGNRADENYLALQDSKGNFILNGDFTIKEYHHRFRVKGGSVEYSGSINPIEQINSSSIIEEQLTVLVLSVGSVEPPNVFYSYSISTGENVRYSWNANGPWTDCDNICQGQKRRRIICTRDDDLIVSDQRCDENTKPSQIIQQCNMHCSIGWKVIYKDQCSAKCGPGLQNQKVRCVKASATSYEITDEKYCSHLPQTYSEIVPCEGKCLQTHWGYDNWSMCSKSCGTGIQTRRAYCLDDRNERLPDTECNIQNKINQQICNDHRCASWTFGDWSGCSTTCGAAKKHRDVWCQNDVDQKIPDEFCNAAHRPKSFIDCNQTECPVWSYGPWSECPKTCGVGWKKRAVQCHTVDNILVQDELCPVHQKPVTMQQCRVAECILPTTPPPKAITYNDENALKWRFGSWTECSSQCGAEGDRQRYVSCTDDQGNTRDDSECSHLIKPTTVERCLSKPCGQWQTGQWGKCTVTCGEGVQTRIVACIHLDHQVEEFKCFKDWKPPAIQPCRKQDCELPSSNKSNNSSHWRVGKWSGCSSTCGSGWQRRRIACNFEDRSRCNILLKPIERKPCNSGYCPGWTYGDWNNCPEACDSTAYQKRTVLCQLPNGQMLPDPNCNLYKKPIESRPCHTTCKEVYVWNVGAWGPCPASCGKSRKYRKVRCINKDNIEVELSKCPGKPLRTSKRCRVKKCPHWYKGPWRPCSVECGNGTKTREVTCKQSKYKTIPDIYCNKKKKPINIKICYPAPCKYIWKKDRWSLCSKTCGFGQKHRSVSCMDYENRSFVEDRHCIFKKPKTHRRCAEFPCPLQWVTGSWSDCSVSCGLGWQYRSVICNSFSKENWILGESLLCKKSEKPLSQRYCNYGDCNGYFFWKVSSWQQCPDACGIQEVNRRVTCIDKGGREYPVTNCNDPVPISKRICPNKRCYVSSCQELRDSTSIRQDSTYRLLIKGKLIPVYCYKMKKNPIEYITLQSSEENYSEIYAKRLKKKWTCPQNGSRINNCYCHKKNFSKAGYTTFSKIRLNLRTLTVSLNDFTFTATGNGRHVPFGTSGDCYSSLDCPQGKFQIDLSGTGFMVSSDTKWISSDEKYHQRISISKNAQLIRGLCGGRCGITCHPDPHIGLRLQLTR